MRVLYHPGKENVVPDAFRRLSMGNASHIEDGKRELVQDLQILCRLGVQLIDSTNDRVVVQSSLLSLSAKGRWCASLSRSLVCSQCS